MWFYYFCFSFVVAMRFFGFVVVISICGVEIVCSSFDHCSEFLVSFVLIDITIVSDPYCKKNWSIFSHCCWGFIFSIPFSILHTFAILYCVCLSLSLSLSVWGCVFVFGGCMYVFVSVCASLFIICVNMAFPLFNIVIDESISFPYFSFLN